MSSMQVNAAVVLSGVIARLEYLPQSFCEINDDLKQMLEKLRSQLSVLQQFLLSKTRIINPGEEDLITILEFCKKVIPLAYDVENAAESHALPQPMPESTVPAPAPAPAPVVGYGIRAMCCSGSCEEDDNNNIISRGLDDLNDLNARIHKLKTDFDCEKVIQNAMTTTSEGPEQDEGRPSRGSSSTSSVPAARRPPEPDSTVGKEEEMQELFSMLCPDYEGRWKLSSYYSRIAIVGMAGSGKTTLAQKVFKDPAVVRHFECRAWAYVGQDFHVRDVLSTILGSLSPDQSRNDITTMELIERLYSAQNGQKCLIVLDDVPSAKAWKAMNFVFLKNPTTKILITTREVAYRLDGVMTHTIRPLTEEESWELFRRSSALRAPYPDDRQREILRMCRGVPLTIVVAAKILQRKTTTTTTQPDEGSEVSNFLASNYNSLPLHEKLCLLYLAQFPCDQKIRVEKLYLLWIAEGLISSTENRGKIDIAEEYLRNLVSRSLIMEQNEDVLVTRTLELFQLNDVIRGVCLYKGKEEDFFEVVDDSRNDSSSTRLAIFLHSQDEYGRVNAVNVPDDAKKKKKIRSLLFFAEHKSGWTVSWPSKLVCLADFVWIRVLHFEKINFEIIDLPKSIDKLVYLRYLGFDECYLWEFPLLCSSFPYMETLYLRVKKFANRKMRIPNVLFKLTNLRHLYFPEEYELTDATKNIRLKLDTLTRLEILENFHAGMCDVDDLVKLDNLQIFTAIADANTVHFKKIINFIDGKKNLRHLSITFNGFNCYSKERREVLSRLFKYDSALRVLHLEGNIKRVPTNMYFAVNLAEIVFDGTEFREDPMDALRGLPRLTSLVLCNDAIVSKKISCCGWGFKRLKSLKIWNLQYLEDWEFQESSSALGNLSILTIEKCDKLSTLPRALMKISALRRMRIGLMPQVFKEQISSIVDEELKMGNDMPIVSFYEADDYWRRKLLSS